MRPNLSVNEDSRMTNSLRLLRTVIGGLVVAFLLAACSGGDEGSGNLGRGDNKKYAFGGTVKGLMYGSLTLTLNNDTANSKVIEGDGSDRSFDFGKVLSSNTAYRLGYLNPVNHNCAVVTGNSSGTSVNADILIGIECERTRFSIGGSVTGLLDGETLGLTLNSGTAETVSAESFTLGENLFLDNGSIYDLALNFSNLPNNRTCIITHATGSNISITDDGSQVSGTVENEDVDISIACDIKRFSLSGIVSGLVGALALTLDPNTLDNGDDDIDLVVSSDDGADENFVYRKALQYDAAYELRLGSPEPDNQNCIVKTDNASGSVNDADITLNVACTKKPFTIAANVAGLETGQVLAISLDERPFDISNGLQVLGNELYFNSGHYYQLKIINNPQSYHCEIDAASNSINTLLTDNKQQIAGEMSGGNVNVQINCDDSLKIAGTITGLATGSVTLRLNDSADPNNNLSIDADLGAQQSFAFPQKKVLGSNFQVSITQSDQHCLFDNNTDSVQGEVEAPLSLTLNCVPTVFGKVRGLVNEGLTLALADTDMALPVTTNNPAFKFFGSDVEDGMEYQLDILNPPAGQLCKIQTGRDGTLYAEPIQIDCSHWSARSLPRANGNEYALEGYDAMDITMSRTNSKTVFVQAKELKDEEKIELVAFSYTHSTNRWRRFVTTSFGDQVDAVDIKIDQSGKVHTVVTEKPDPFEGDYALLRWIFDSTQDAGTVTPWADYLILDSGKRLIGILDGLDFVWEKATVGTQYGRGYTPPGTDIDVKPLQPGANAKALQAEIATSDDLTYAVMGWQKVAIVGDAVSSVAAGIYELIGNTWINRETSMGNARSRHIKVAINNQKEAAVLWQQDFNNDGRFGAIRANFYNPSTNQWRSTANTVVNLEDDNIHLSEMTIAIDDSGRVMAVWTQRNGSDLSVSAQVSYFDADSDEWSTPTSLADLPTSMAPDSFYLEINNDGQAILLWRDLDNSIKVANYAADAGGWSDSVMLDDDLTSNKGLLKVVMDDDGRAFALIEGKLTSENAQQTEPFIYRLIWPE